MKNSKLRKQLEELESENRRLTLAREVALSPVEITRSARQLGFVNTLDTEAFTRPVEPARTAAAESRQAKTNVDPGTPGLTRTSYQRPALTAGATAGPRQPSEKPVKNAETQKARTPASETTAFAKLR